MTEDQREAFRLTPQYVQLISCGIQGFEGRPEGFYRVCVKARIRDHEDRLYLVKEDGSGWALPGGGIELGETIDEALARELLEEVALTEPFSARHAGTQAVYIPARGAWAFWLIYDVDVESVDHLGRGSDADDASFVSIDSLSESDIRSELLVHLWGR